MYAVFAHPPVLFVTSVFYKLKIMRDTDNLSPDYSVSGFCFANINTLPIWIYMISFKHDQLKSNYHILF